MENDGLSKLLPKSINKKRRLRKQRRAANPGQLRRESSSLADSDGTSVSNLGEDDDDGDDRSVRDDRSFGSFESGPDPEAAPKLRAASSLTGTEKSSKSSRSASRATSQSPSRPGTVSQHPSLIGYLTTSSPVVQAAHIEPGSLSPSQSSIVSRTSRAHTTGSPHPPTLASTEIPADLPSIGLPAAAKVAPLSPRSRASTERSRAVPPLSPSTFDKNRPEIVNTPPTPDQPTLEEAEGSDKRGASWGLPLKFNNADGSRIAEGHKRTSSASATIGPSKLSNVITSPLTPPAESSEGNTNSSFFSSMLSAAQNAATNLSTNIQNSGIALGGNKGRSTPSKSQVSLHNRAASQPENKSPALTESTPPSQSSSIMDQKDSAVRTLGAGDLSLSQLGIEEPASTVASPSASKFAEVDSRARSESAPADAVTSNGEFIPEGAPSRPLSLNEGTSGNITPPQHAEPDDKHDLSRAGSLRRAHRKRGSSVTTTATGINLGVPLAGVTSPITQPAANVSAPKLTGFAIASKKRNKDFHAVFKSVPDDDYLIEDYSCALQREILAHGRLYVSEGHLCFSSNIMGWTTTLVMSFDEIVSVEKRSTALIFKNGLMISTLHAKHVFASFTSRDATYDLIVNIWKLGHPTLTSTLNGVRLEGTGGDKTEKVDGEEGNESDSPSDSGSDEDSEEGDEFYDEEVEEGLDNEAAEPAAEVETEKAVTRKASGMTTSNGVTGTQNKDAVSAAGGAEFPGPVTHAPTECTDGATHYDKVVGDDIIPAPLGRVYNLMFGAESSAFMTKFLTSDQKCSEIAFEDKKGLSLDDKTRTYTYIKPLNGPIGPKSTKCIITETVDGLDFEKAASVSMVTQTPDVPSGNLFMVKTKYCLTWADNNSTRVHMNCTIEWSGKSWLRTPIDKAAADGQADFAKSIFAMLKSTVSARGRSNTGSNGAPAKLKKKSKKGKATPSSTEGVEKKPIKKEEPNWGPLEPVRQIIEPLADIVKPLLTGNVMYGLLVGLLVATWFGFGFTPSRSMSPYAPHAGIYGTDRVAAYEEIWRREDSELWDWLEERIGLDRLNAEGSNARKKAMSPRTADQKLREERMDAKEMEEAMRVTQEKLKILQEALGRTSSQVPEGAASHAELA